jgi:hypothetical protein
LSTYRNGRGTPPRRRLHPRRSGPLHRDRRESGEHTGRAEVADRHVDLLATGLRAQAGDHGLGAVDARDAYAALGERQRNPAGADPELQRSSPSCGELFEHLHDRRHHRRIEHVGGALVVDGRSAFAEETFSLACFR